MKFIKFPIVPILGGFSIGIVIQYYFQIALLSILLGLTFNTFCFLAVYFYVIKKKLNTLNYNLYFTKICRTSDIDKHYFICSSVFPNIYCIFYYYSFPPFTNSLLLTKLTDNSCACFFFVISTIIIILSSYYSSI